ncbi:sulfite exporter TauE/SafE family protein [Ornithinimicrobium cavernae]|uniref:sulfite exporter TauE/SafE family protein n=1 Tax=Ornithinimicrobium cavernae TaxID=2666047 RepID=UPI000D69F0F1|nr:sulfite exporter TauE/SafE family protein [Ornithinimicrobium cavernae]
MEWHLMATVVLTVVVGLSLGLLGGGGSILMVPILTYVARMEPQQAISASLVVVGVTSAVSALVHARHRRVRWRAGVVVGASGMAGAFAGGLIGGHLPGQVLMVVFALIMLAAGGAMLRRRRQAAGDRAADPSFVITMTVGLGVGIVTGLVGAGGGFLLVPALALLGGLPMSVAVGTSLLVIAMNSVAGLAGQLTTTVLDWPVIMTLAVVAVAGSFAGARLQTWVPEAQLRRWFGYFVLAMGVFVLAQELPAVAATAVVSLAALVLAAVILCRIPSIPCPRALRRTTS